MAEDEQETIDPPMFGYAGEPCGQRYEFWREEICRRVMMVDIVPLAPGPIRCNVKTAALPLVQMVVGEGTAMQFLSRGTDAGSEFALVLSHKTPTRFIMSNRTLDLGPMDVGLMDSSLAGADVSILGEGQSRSLSIDRKALLLLCPHAEDRVARPLGVSRAVRALLNQYHDLVFRQAAGLDAATQSAIAQHLIDLTVLALGTGADAAELARSRGFAAARFEAIKADILARLDEGDLSLAGVAARHRASPRYVQVLFERAGLTYSEFVLEQRLLLARRLLGSAVRKERKISDIAHLAGFGDVSYFHRAFRKRFGATPGDIRSASNAGKPRRLS